MIFDEELAINLGSIVMDQVKSSIIWFYPNCQHNLLLPPNLYHYIYQLYPLNFCYHALLNKLELGAIPVYKYSFNFWMKWSDLFGVYHHCSRRISQVSKILFIFWWPPQRHLSFIHFVSAEIGSPDVHLSSLVFLSTIQSVELHS